MSNNTGALFGRVTKVMQTVKALEPDKRHQQGYMYISSDKVLQAISSAMAQNGLVIVPSVTGQTVEVVEYTSNNNKAMTRFDASVTFGMTLADSEGNDHTAVWVGCGSDFTSPDKAIYKAITSGHKYFMLKLFVVGAGNEDSEHDEVEPGHVTTRSQPRTNGNANKPTPPALTDELFPAIPESLKRKFHAVGGKVYGDEWNDKRAELVNTITKGKSRSSNDLTREQMEKLIEGIEKKMAQQSHLITVDEPATDAGYAE